MEVEPWNNTTTQKRSQEKVPENHEEKGKIIIFEEKAKINCEEKGYNEERIEWNNPQRKRGLFNIIK